MVNVLVVGAAALCVVRLQRREVTRARASVIIRDGLKSRKSWLNPWADTQDEQARDDLVPRDHASALL